MIDMVETVPTADTISPEQKLAIQRDLKQRYMLDFAVDATIEELRHQGRESLGMEEADQPRTALEFWEAEREKHLPSLLAAAAMNAQKFSSIRGD